MDFSLLCCFLDDLIGRDCFLGQTDNESTGFNIFKALGIEAKEVLTCRFLGAILEPNGAHDLKTEPLRLFLKTVLNVNETAAEIKDESVVLEEVIKDNRRVDIVIRNGGKVYPIEVKIDAGDQDSQLEDYYKYFFKDDESQKIYYLTPTGWKPSEKSKGNLKDENIVRLSFSDDIKKWIFEVSKTKNIRPGIAGIINQYREVIEDMCAAENKKETVRKALNWKNGLFELTPNTKALIELLALNGDKNGDLQKMLQIEYLKKWIEFDPDKYEYVDEPEAEKKKAIDSHALLYIGKKASGNTPIAWICVDTNLYLACDNRDSDASGWHGNENWAYLNLDGKGKPFQMNDCLRLLEEGKKIKIDSFLSVIKA